MIRVGPQPRLTPSPIVHAIATSGMGFQLLCDARWLVEDSVYHARVVTEVDPLGRSTTFSLTRDPVDCMSCLVAQARP